MRFVLTILLAVLLLPAFSRAEEARISEEFADGSGFSYQAPSGWKVMGREGQPFKVVLNEAAAVDGLAPNIMIKDGVFPGTMEAFAEQTRAGFKKAYPNFNELGADMLHTEGGADFIRITATNELKGHKVRQTYFLYDGPRNIKLAMTVTVPVTVAERFDGVLEITAKSFRFESGIVVSTVLSSHFADMMKRMVDQIKTSGELGKDPTDDVIKLKALDPVFTGLTSEHALEVTKPQERDFVAGKFLEESNQKILNDLCSFIEVFKTEKPVAAKFVIAEQKAGKLKGADVEVGIRIMKWSLNKLKESLKVNQQTKDLEHPDPAVGPKTPPIPPLAPSVAPAPNAPPPSK